MTKYTIYIRLEGRKSYIKLNDSWIEGETLEDARKDFNESIFREHMEIAFMRPVAEVVFKKMRDQHQYDSCAIYLEK